MRKVRAKKLRKLAQIITAQAPETMKVVYRRLKKTWNEAKFK
jgi:acyl-CoA reductase-like NAD-dependent aldehyde dehydrogenase